MENETKQKTNKSSNNSWQILNFFWGNKDNNEN
jgi:hypothetical protein